VRVHNFGAGPAALPQTVLETAQEELLDFAGTGRSILETSHRSPVYGRVHDHAIEQLRSLIGNTGEHEVLFMTGGARTQFSLVPMNLLPRPGRAGYLVTGHWSEQAVAAARRLGDVRELWSGRERGYDRVPGAPEYSADPDLSYFHYTSNNTIYGTQFSQIPEPGSAPLVCDMSSDILSIPLDASRFGLIYAGAQKNLGPAGVTIVLIRKDLLGRVADTVPDTLSYSRMAAKNSLLNTPPVFAIYMVGLVLADLEARGGLDAAGERNSEKATRLYSAIDGSGGFYRGHAEAESRSQMNVTFRLPTEALEKMFLVEGEKEGLTGLRGHRSVGGIRASIYNAVSIESVDALTSFMTDFRRRRG
jgi:phosphoserine aminotransferase